MLTKINEHMYIDLSRVRSISVISNECCEITYHDGETDHFQVDALGNLYADICIAVEKYKESLMPINYMGGVKLL